MATENQPTTPATPSTAKGRLKTALVSNSIKEIQHELIIDEARLADLLEAAGLKLPADRKLTVTADVELKNVVDNNGGDTFRNVNLIQLVVRWIHAVTEEEPEGGWSYALHSLNDFDPDDTGIPHETTAVGPAFDRQGRPLPLRYSPAPTQERTS